MTSTWWHRLVRRQHPHLTDSRLLKIILATSEDTDPSHQDLGAENDHLHRCPGCAGRLEDLRTFLDNTIEEYVTEFDDVFSAEHLARQRAFICQRLERATQPTRPGRILRFPARARPALIRIHTARWWLAAATAAGLLGGVGLGQFVHLHPESNLPVEPALTRAVPAEFRHIEATATLTGSTPLEADAEAFMDRVESMLVDPEINELRPLDAITPRALEVALSPW